MHCNRAIRWPCPWTFSSRDSHSASWWMRLSINGVELNIWFYWKRQKKDAAATIPRRSLVSKVYWVREWEKASL
ncbi:hypothetical protein PsorP6_014509 [Peronosclerospora sorghi]|uniref:Uncharacterized protein n=1 Tax=Peronosclerospora sorghi TaxID=230839 RepID=A0ACC0VTI2_9STRA|nr:hypothetical protein PsorP6_014509 [Peronosclerospora sorghi]